MKAMRQAPCRSRNLTLAAILLASSGFAGAAQHEVARPAAIQFVKAHVIAVRVFDGREGISDEVVAADGKQTESTNRWVGPSRITKVITIGVLLNKVPDAAGVFDLQYQVKLSAESKGQIPSIQAQGELNMRAGDLMRPVECGSWTVDINLDHTRYRGGAHETDFLPEGKRTPVEAGAVRGNYRITAEATRGRVGERCGQVLKLGSQGNVVDGLSTEGGMLGMVFNGLAQPSGDSGKFSLQYRIQYTPVELSMSHFHSQGEETLALGRRHTAQVQGYTLDLMIEGEPLPPNAGSGVPSPGTFVVPTGAEPPPVTDSGKGEPQPAPEVDKAVPLLR